MAQYGVISKLSLVVAAVICAIYLFRIQTVEQEKAGLTRCAHNNLYAIYDSTTFVLLLKDLLLMPSVVECTSRRTVLVLLSMTGMTDTMQGDAGAAHGDVIHFGSAVLGGGRLRGHVGVGEGECEGFRGRAAIGQGSAADCSTSGRLLCADCARHGGAFSLGIMPFCKLCRSDGFLR